MHGGSIAEIMVGRLLLVWEYIPAQHGGKYGPRQKLGHIFECHLANGSVPTMPATPDAFQSNVKWIPLSDLLSPTAPPLLPTIGSELVEALKTRDLPVRVVDWS